MSQLYDFAAEHLPRLFLASARNDIQPPQLDGLIERQIGESPAFDGFDEFGCDVVDSQAAELFRRRFVAERLDGLDLAGADAVNTEPGQVFRRKIGEAEGFHLLDEFRRDTVNAHAGQIIRRKVAANVRAHRLHERRGDAMYLEGPEIVR